MRQNFFYRGVRVCVCSTSVEVTKKRSDIERVCDYCFCSAVRGFVFASSWISDFTMLELNFESFRALYIVYDARTCMMICAIGCRDVRERIKKRFAR